MMHHLHIFLSYPGDVDYERELAWEVIDLVQSERAHREWLKLEAEWDLVEEFFAEFQNPDGSYKSFYRDYDEPYEDNLSFIHL